MEKSGEYSKLKKKLKRKAEETEKKISSKKCKLLQDYEDQKDRKTSKSVKKGKGAAKTDGVSLVEKNNKENGEEYRTSTKSKKKKKKDKVKDGSSAESERDTIVTTNCKEDTETNVQGVKLIEDTGNTENSIKGDKSSVDIKEKKRKKRREKKAAKVKQKEQQKERTAEGAESGGGGKDPAIDYLQKWKTQRDEWSFQKVRQVWLLQHMYNGKLVSDADFTVLLEYLEGLQGKARCVTVEKAESIVDKSEDLEDVGEKEKEQLLSETDRARQIIQMLS